VDQPDVNRLLTYLKQGMTYASQSRYELALKEFEQVQKIDPNFLAMHENIAAAQLKLQNLPGAEAHLQEELKLIGCLDQTSDANLPRFAYMLEVGQKGTGDADAARAQMMRERLKQAGGVAHYNLACVRARQGAAAEAVAELRQAVERGFSDVSALNRDPDLAMVRSAPGFQDVVIAASTEAAAKRR
jgi:tetratricopeptide (TPR) repeat protein